jgi:membrane-bound metal-dependent hydrolase YbcI (DUF457 family)
MDIVSHGLWGGIAVGRESKRRYWQAFGFGVAPDLLSFGLFTVGDALGFVSGPDWGHGRPDPTAIPLFVHQMYNITHSLVVFAAVFGVVWLVRKRPFLPMIAWCLHILLDIPTHSSAFFPTPFLWPVSDLTFQGISWGQPIIFFPNVALLVIAYGVWWMRRGRAKAPAA